MFGGLLVVGGSLRVVTWLAYQPALIYFDSSTYLYNAAHLGPMEARPLGYGLFLRALPLFGELAVVPAVQHLMGLGIAALIYLVLLRLELPRWGAALAAAPVLLDAYQLNIEQYVLSETLYELLLVGACAALVWRPRPNAALAAGAGALLAAAALTRASGLLVVIPALLAVALLARRPAPVLALLVAFAVPVVGYAAWVEAEHGSFGVTTFGGRFLYARVAPFADCAKFTVKAYERPLCEPPGNRKPVEVYMWSGRRSPLLRLPLPPGKTRPQVGSEFARKVIAHQPLTYAGDVGHDLLRGFYPTRTRHEGELPISRWHFQTHFPIYRDQSRAVLRNFHAEGTVDRGLAGFLRGYQRVGYVPNLLLGLGLLLALAAPLLRRADARLKWSAFLFAATALAVLLPTAAANQFTWRYQIPQLVLLPVATALALRLVTILPREDPRSGR